MTDPLTVVRKHIEVQRTAEVAALDDLLRTRNAAKDRARTAQKALDDVQRELDASTARIEAFESWLAENPEPLVPFIHHSEKEAT